MSTWHQDKAGPVIAPADKWTILVDAPNVLRTMYCFDTEAEARKRLDSWRAAGRAAHATLLAPTAGASPIL